MTAPPRGASSGAALYWGTLGCLWLVLIGVVWWVDVLPGQDLPQHLAYVRILLDYDDPELAFRELYLLPERFQSYFTTYYLLAFLARWLSVEGAVRCLLSLYIVAVPLCFDRLARSLRPASRGEPWIVLLSPLVIVNPCLLMGFLQFALAVPLWLLAAAFLFRASGPGGGWREGLIALALGVLIASMHLVAAGALGLLCVLGLLVGRGRQRSGWAVAMIVVLAVTVGLWAHFGEAGIGDPTTLQWSTAVKRAHGLEFLNEVFRITWYDPVVKTNYVLWTALGPYRWQGQAWTLLALLLVAASLWLDRQPGRRRGAPGVPPELRRTVLGFAIVAWLLPWGVAAPSEATFIDFRLFTLAWPLLLGLVDPALFSSRRARRALAVAGLVVTVNFGVRAAAFAGEARPALELVRQARPRGVLMSLTFHNRSSHFGKLFRLTHFLPMYYLVRERGVATQFWARYVHHLPVDYRAGSPPALTPDWYPWQFQPTDLRDSDYLLVQYATMDSSPDLAAASARIATLIPAYTRRLDCAANWCLYQVDRLAVGALQR